VTAEIDNKILNRLEAESKKEGFDPRFLEFYQRLLRLQSGVEQRIVLPEPSLSSEAISERLEHGLPLISFDEFPLDWSLLQETFGEVTGVFADYAELFGEIPQSLKKLSQATPIIKETVKAWFEGAELPSATGGDEVSGHLLDAIIHATLSPFLTSRAKALIGSVEQERWRRRYCPICGGKADFAFLDKERGARWLLCSRCDAEWLFQRLECPYCGNKDQNTLAYFTDDKELYRLYVCEQCHTYIKAIDSRRTESEVLLPLERIMTLDIDRQGQEKGYQPGHSSNQPGSTSFEG
jgi:FdhE protein